MRQEISGQAPLLRPATVDDAQPIATLHASVWRDTYRSLATPAALDTLTETHRLQQWHAMLATEETDRVTIIAEIDKRVIGFTQLALPQEPLFGDRREIKYLYVARSHARQGVGRCLLRHVAELALHSGVASIGLGVVVGNEAAIKFYQTLGAHLVGRYQDPGPLWRSDNLLYAWDDLALLIEPAVSGG
jgi:RimJ/RimL family protein N-acetyltransferase